MDLEYIVLDPVLDEVSCADEADARKYASVVDGVAYVVFWLDGEEVSRAKLD